jgi:ribonucleotide reductase beta subunit family protein with ferritin-like domain
MTDHFFEALDEKTAEAELESYQKKYPYFDVTLDDTRTNMIPVCRKQFYDMYIYHRDRFWKHDEILFDVDVHHYNALDPKAQKLIDGVIGFFSVGDKIINDNIECGILEHIPYQEVKLFYRFKAMMEDVHAMTYSATAEHFYPDKAKLRHIQNAVREMEPVKKKVNFAKKYFNSSVDYPTRQIAEICLELILFAGSFAIIYYFKGLGKFPTFCRFNELISRDEICHGKTGCDVFNHIKPELRPTEEAIIKIIDDAIVGEKEFICDLLPEKILGLNKEMLCEYIEFIGNYTLDLLDIGPVYKTSDRPTMLNYIDSIEYSVKNDFFNASSTQYLVSNFDITSKVDVDEDF